MNDFLKMLFTLSAVFGFLFSYLLLAFSYEEMRKKFKRDWEPVCYWIPYGLGALAVLIAEDIRRINSNKQ